MGSYSTLTVSLLPESEDSSDLLAPKEPHQQQKHVDCGAEEDPQDPSKLEVWDETKKALALAWPLSLFNVAGFSILVITLMFVGHLGELELSSASIATSFSAVTGFIVMVSSPYPTSHRMHELPSDRPATQKSIRFRRSAIG